MKAQQTYQVRQLAKLAGVSVRTLHHYDEVGLLAPKTRSAAGYRLYSNDDLLRLQQILIGRELGLSLEEIRKSLDDPRFDRRQALISQRDALQRRVRQTNRMIEAIDAALVALDPQNKGGTMSGKALFDGFDPSVYEDEAKARWGNTDAYKESAKRTRRYTRDNWSTIKTEQESIYDDAFALKQAGEKPVSAAAMDVAERHRLSIDRWFYPCSHQMHAGLASLYESDERFATSIDKHGAELTPFLVAAIRANAKRQRT